MFEKEFSDDIFDDFMMNRACQAALFADFITLLNMKATDNIDNPEKMALLTEILNDLKLFVIPPVNEKSH